MSGRDATKQINLGPAEITFNGTIIGHSGKDGVKIKITPKTVPGIVAEGGDEAPVNMWLNSMKVVAELEVQQTGSFDVLAAAFPFFNSVASGGNTKITGGDVSGKQITAGVLTIHPINQGTNKTYDFTLQAAVPLGMPEIDFIGSKPQGWKASFEGLYVPTLGDGNRQWVFGDPTITADVTPPTATSVPADDAVAVGAITQIVLTASEPLDGRTCIPANMKLIQWSAAIGSTPTLIAITGVTLVNNGASTTVTITFAALATGKSFSFSANNLTDQNGNLLSSGSFYIDFGS